MTPKERAREKRLAKMYPPTSYFRGTGYGSASAMSASGQDAGERLGPKDASAVRDSGDAQTPSSNRSRTMMNLSPELTSEIAAFEKRCACLDRAEEALRHMNFDAFDREMSTFKSMEPKRSEAA